jgi:hypothetical protein
MPPSRKATNNANEGDNLDEIEERIVDTDEHPHYVWRRICGSIIWAEIHHNAD